MSNYDNPLHQIWQKTKHPSDKWRPYFEVYWNHLHGFQYRSDVLQIVEVGVQKGGSLEMWSEFLKHARITGIDVDPECANLKYDDERIDVIIGDQSDPAFWDSFLPGRKIDIFIDDGGHYMDQQILTFEKVFPTMPLGSVYICEDTHTSYMSYNGGGLNNPKSFIEYSKSYIDVLHSSWFEGNPPEEMKRRIEIARDLTNVHFYDSMVVFEKKGKRSMERCIHS